MNAVEVIEKIKNLPPDEQRKVFNFVAQFERENLGLPQVRYAPDDEFRAAAKHVFETHDKLFRKLAASERAEREDTLPGSSI
jgi:hypothetical protein